MNDKRLFPIRLYIRKFVNTFFPRFFFGLSPQRYWAQQHWKSQNAGDIHGYDKYIVLHPRIQVMIKEIQSRVTADQPVLDLGCNCGYYLSLVKKEGYTNLSGIDISPVALKYGQEHFDLKGVDLINGSFENVLPELISTGKKFDLIYTLGATVELVHPSSDIIRHICSLSEKYVILIINEWGHSYPRFWEYEFSRNGFLLVKCIRPFDGVTQGKNFINCESLLVFEKIQ